MSTKTYITIALGLILLYAFYSISNAPGSNDELIEVDGVIDTAYYYSNIEDYWIELDNDEHRYYLEEVDSSKAHTLAKMRTVQIFYYPAKSWFGMNENVVELKFVVSGTDTVYSRIIDESKD